MASCLRYRKAIGVCLSFGYTLMLHEKLNLEFGAGMWAGRRYEHVLYCCPDCMQVRESGSGNFVALFCTEFLMRGIFVLNIREWNRPTVTLSTLATLVLSTSERNS